MTEKNTQLVARLEADFQAALKARESDRVSALRMLRAALQNEAIAQRVPTLDDEAAMRVVQKEAKRRREAVEQFRAGGRNDLAEKESKELEVLVTYLPAALTDDELQALVDGAQQSSGLQTKADFGKLMGLVMKSVGGRADGNRVSAAVKAALE